MEAYKMILMAQLAVYNAVVITWKEKVTCVGVEGSFSTPPEGCAKHSYQQDVHRSLVGYRDALSPCMLARGYS